MFYKTRLISVNNDESCMTRTSKNKNSYQINKYNSETVRTGLLLNNLINTSRTICISYMEPR